MTTKPIATLDNILLRIDKALHQVKADGLDRYVVAIGVDVDSYAILSNAIAR